MKFSDKHTQWDSLINSLCDLLPYLINMFLLCVLCEILRTKLGVQGFVVRVLQTVVKNEPKHLKYCNSVSITENQQIMSSDAQTLKHLVKKDFN